MRRITGLSIYGVEGPHNLAEELVGAGDMVKIEVRLVAPLCAEEENGSNQLDFHGRQVSNSRGRPVSNSCVGLESIRNDGEVGIRTLDTQRV